MKKLLITTILTCSCAVISIAQEEKVQKNETNVRTTKATLKEKSSESLSSPEKGSGTVKETKATSGNARRTKAVVKKSSKQLEIKGVPEGVSTESKEEYKKSKLEWKATHKEEYDAKVKARKTLIKKEEFDQLSPERQKIILSNPELYEITK